MTPTVPRTLLLAVGALLLVAAAVGVTLAITRGEDDGGENSTVSPTIVPKAALPSGRELATQIRTRPESITGASVITDGSRMCPYVVWMGPIKAYAHNDFHDVMRIDQADGTYLCAGYPQAGERTIIRFLGKNGVPVADQ